MNQGTLTFVQPAKKSHCFLLTKVGVFLSIPMLIGSKFINKTYKVINLW